MEINFKQELKTVYGKDILDEKKQKMTLENVCVAALQSCVDESDNKVSGQEKFDRYNLCSKIVNTDGPVELKVEEVTKIKERIGRVFTPAVVGPAWNLLEKNEEK